MCLRILSMLLVLWFGWDARAAATSVPGCPPPVPLAHERWAGQAQWLAIEHAGLHYGALAIQVRNVYDFANAQENTWYTRAADSLHIRTRHWALRQLLLIKPGQRVNAQQVYVAIRHLREQPFLQSATIMPTSCTDAVVNATVKVHDAWTLKIDTSFGRSGGSSQWRFKLVDSNFLGTGRRLAIGHQQTLERSVNLVQFITPTFLGTDWRLLAEYQQLSDGRRSSLKLIKPFLRNTTPWGGGVTVIDQRLHLGFYQQGRQAWYLPQHKRYLHAQWQRLLGFNGVTTWRAGVAAQYARYRYGAPVAVQPGELAAPAPYPRTLVGIGPVLSMHQDRYASFENIRSVGRTEDYNLGWEFSVQALANLEALGADSNGPQLSTQVSKGFRPWRPWLVLTHAAASARRTGGLWHNLSWSASATAYGQPWPWQTLVIHADIASLRHPDPENRLYIGSSDGLRGYPNFHASGTRRLRVTIADRIVTPVVWFHSFRVGFVVFSDNAIIDRGPGKGWSPWLSTLGAGFRLGNLRGANNPVLFFTVAMPLNAPPGIPRHLVWAVGNEITF